jgi:hypothetical protein
MQLALLATVADESRTMLPSGLILPQACTIAVSVIAALPFTGIPHLRFSANAEPDAGLECFQGTTAVRPLV